MSAPVYVVLGAGPGLGLATARVFGREGYDVVLVGRTAARVAPLVETLSAEGVSAEAAGADLADESAVRALVDDIGSRHGRIDVLHFNPSVWREADVLHLTPMELFEDLAIGVAPLLPAVQAAIGFMPRGGRVLATGSMAADEPSPSAPSLGVQKAALRNLVTSLDATLADRGVRAVAVQVNGTLAAEGRFAHAAVAEALHAAVTRPEGEWTPHVGYDGGAS